MEVVQPAGLLGREAAGISEKEGVALDVVGVEGLVALFDVVSG